MSLPHIPISTFHDGLSMSILSSSMGFEALFVLFYFDFSRFCSFFNFFQIHSVLAVFAGEFVEAYSSAQLLFSLSWRGMIGNFGG